MKIIFNDNIKLTDIKVFACVPGAGKTFLTSYSDEYVDIDRIRSNYTHNRPVDFSVEEHEKLKGGDNTLPETIERKKAALNYIKNVILENLNAGKKLLITPSPDIVNYIIELKIPYCLVYFDINDNDLIKKRLHNRGNKQKFIDKNCEDNIVKMYYKMNSEDQKPSVKIELSGNEYLTDIHKRIKN